MMARILSTVSYPVWSSILINRNPFFGLHQHHRQQKGSSIRKIVNTHSNRRRGTDGHCQERVRRRRHDTDQGRSLSVLRNASIRRFSPSCTKQGPFGNGLRLISLILPALIFMRKTRSPALSNKLLKSGRRNSFFEPSTILTRKATNLSNSCLSSAEG